jgi:hypothetical protein
MCGSSKKRLKRPRLAGRSLVRASAFGSQNLRLKSADYSQISGKNDMD